MGECPELLRINLDIKDPAILLYQYIDFKINGTSKRIIFYNSEYLDKSKDISYCENQNLTQDITYIQSIEELKPYIIGSKHGDDIIQFINQGLDIFNVYSPIYNDPCYALSTLNKVDLTLNERREDMIKLNFTLCKPGCLFEGVNFEKEEILCFCKDYINVGEKSMSDGFTEGFINLGKSKNIEIIKCIKKVFDVETQKYNYISEIITLFLIIEIICCFDCERGIKKYIKNLINFSLENLEEHNDDSIISENHNDNRSFIQLTSSFFNKIFELFSSNFANDYDIIKIFISQNKDDYNEINITSIKIIMFVNQIIVTLFLNTLFLDDEAMHNIRENNGKYNIMNYMQ